MNTYTFTVTFSAANMNAAEDFAADMKVFSENRGRSALYYDDPITGKMALWAEPAMSHEELKMRRSYGK